MDETNYIIDGKMKLQKFNQLFFTQIESDEVDTIAGYIIEEIGYFPEDQAKVSVRVDNFLLTTEKVENGRILSVHVEQKIAKPSIDKNQNEL